MELKNRSRQIMKKFIALRESLLSSGKFFKLRRFRLSQKLIIGAALLLAGVGLYFLWALRSVSSAQLSLAELKSSWDRDIICHEACALSRQKDEDVVIAGLKKDHLDASVLAVGAESNQSGLSRQFRSYFEEPGAKAGFQKELINLWSEAAGPDNPSAYFKNYFQNASSGNEVAAAMLTSFSAASLTGTDDSGQVDPPLTYYFNLLKSTSSLDMKQAAIKFLSNYPDKPRDFSKQQLVLIKSLILDKNTATSLRQSLVLLLDDYYQLFPKMTILVWQNIYQSKNTDEISRLFTADLLNQEAGQNLALPEVSMTAWQNYYHN